MMDFSLLGTRADALVDVVFLLVLATPLVMYLSFRLASRADYRAHRRVQTVLFTVLVLGVVLFEIDIRITGGSGSLVAGSPYAGTTGFTVLAIAHIGGAVLTYVAWCTLLVMSRRRFQERLPGTFSALHRRLGLGVFIGTLYTAATAAAMYTVGFVL